MRPVAGAAAVFGLALAFRVVHGAPAPAEPRVLPVSGDIEGVHDPAVIRRSQASRRVAEMI